MDLKEQRYILGPTLVYSHPHRQNNGRIRRNIKMFSACVFPHHSCVRPGSSPDLRPVCTSQSGWSKCCHDSHRSALWSTAKSWHWRQSRWGPQRSAWSPPVARTSSRQVWASLLEEAGQKVASLKLSPSGKHWLHSKAHTLPSDFHRVLQLLLHGTYCFACSTRTIGTTSWWRWVLNFDLLAIATQSLKQLDKNQWSRTGGETVCTLELGHWDKSSRGSESRLARRSGVATAEIYQMDLYKGINPDYFANSSIVWQVSTPWFATKFIYHIYMYIYNPLTFHLVTFYLTRFRLKCHEGLLEPPAHSTQHTGWKQWVHPR